MIDRDRILKLKKEAFVLNIDFDNKEKILIGKSKIGGCPDLPKTMKWPEGFAFIGQINLSELNDEEMHNYNLDKGILYFFYDFHDDTLGYDSDMPNGIKVFFYDGDMSEIETVQYPETLEEDYCIPMFDVTFTKQIEVPMYEEYLELVDTDIDWDDYLDLVEELNLDHDEDCEITKFLGYADLIHGSMISHCKKMCSDDNAEKTDWILLLQVDTISNSEFEIAFSDYGRLYYYIRRTDLLKKNFDRCWYVVQ